MSQTLGPLPLSLSGSADLGDRMLWMAAPPTVLPFPSKLPWWRRLRLWWLAYWSSIGWSPHGC